MDEGFGDPDVYARRTRVGARKFGAVVNAGHPRDAMQAYTVDASAVGGVLDILGNFNIGTTTTAVTSHRRIRPGLTLRARPRAVRRGEPTEVRFTVLDAGDPVQGARVRAGGESARTNSQGRVTLLLSPRRPLDGEGDAPRLYARVQAAPRARLTLDFSALASGSWRSAPTAST